MVIRELSNEECHCLLAKTRLARLACALNNQPYVVPVYLAYHEASPGDACFYGFTTVGQKVDWMRANPQVCVEVEEIANCTHWTTVVAFGRYEELPEIPKQNVTRLPARHLKEARQDFAPADETSLAYQLLQTQAMWWEPASTARAALAHRGAEDLFRPIYYKVSIEQVTGHQAEASVAAFHTTIEPEPRGGRFDRVRRALANIFRDRLA